MNRSRVVRWGMRTSLGLVASLALLGVLSIEGLDERPYFRQSYFTNTVMRLSQATLAWPVARGELFAGFGKAPLTPSLGASEPDPASGRFVRLPLAGYGARRGAAATGVHDDLWVKAVALRVGPRVAVWISAEALIVPREVTDIAADRLRAEAGLERSQIYFSATHTHASLGGWGEGWVAEAFAGAFDPGVRVWFAGQLVSAAKAALEDLAPATGGEGSVRLPALVRNRLVGEAGRVDDEFSFAVVEQADGDRAVVGAYAAHATVLPSGVMEFSGDYPGAWARALEAGGGGMGVFLAGGMGSHGPRAGAPGFEGVERMGRLLAEAVLAELPRIQRQREVALGVVGVTVDLPELHVRVGEGWRLRPWVAGKLIPASSPTFLQALRFGEQVWIATPCDFSGELGLEVKRFARALGLRAVVTSFNGDYIGYVIPPRYYHLGGYEPRTMSFYGPLVPDYFTDLMERMLEGWASPL